MLTHVNNPQKAAAAATSPPGKYRRRPPSPAEQRRRQAWGAKWGKLVRDATRGIKEGKR